MNIPNSPQPKCLLCICTFTSTVEELVVSRSSRLLQAEVFHQNSDNPHNVQVTPSQPEFIEDLREEAEMGLVQVWNAQKQNAIQHKILVIYGCIFHSVYCTPDVLNV